jgi:respiratory burst oxidase
VLGCAIGFFSLVHVGAHLCDFYSFSYADEEDIVALLGEGMVGMPADAPGRWRLALLQTRAGVTGIVMVLCCLLAYPLAAVRKTHFDAFWNSHHLLSFVMLVALCVHGTDNLLEHFQSVYWLALPLCLYWIPRFWRELPVSTARIMDVQVKAKVVILRLEKPTSWQGRVRPGMYAFVKVPAISSLQWHPFTLTSAPSDPYIEFHMQKAGD